METSSLSPAENDIVRLATEMLEAAGLAYVLIAQNRHRAGGDLFANIPVPNVMRVAQQVVDCGDLAAHEVGQH